MVAYDGTVILFIALWQPASAIFRFLFDVGELSYSFQVIDPKFNHDV